MEIRTTYTERQCKEYAHYWSRIYTSGIRRKEDEGGNGRLILSLAVHFLAYLLGWGALRIILGYLLMWHSDRQMIYWFQQLFFGAIFLSFLLSEILKRIWLYEITVKELGKRKELTISIEETGLRYRTKDGQWFWPREETNPVISLKSTLVLSRGEIRNIRGIKEKVLLIPMEDLTAEQRRALAGWKGCGKREKVQRWWLFDLAFFAGILGILSAGVLYLAQARQLTLYSFELEMDPEYQTSAFLESCEGYVFSSTGEDAEEIVSDGIKGLFDSLEMDMHYFGPVSCDEVQILYEDGEKIAAEVKVTVQPAEPPAPYNFIADDMDPEKDTRVQELVLLERQENDEYQISEIGAEINIIGEGNKEPRQAE